MEKRIKRILSISLSVLVSTMLVAGIVMAATTIGSNITTAGDITVNTNKFIVAGASGNTTVAGTLGVTGASTLTGALAANGGITVDTTAFTVADTSGNVATTGTLAVTGVSTLTGATTVTGALYANGGLDRSTAAALAVGATNASAVDISKTLITTTVKGLLNVDEAVTFDTTLGVTGITTLTGLLNANGGIAVDTSAFTVADTTGAVHTAGDFDVATNKFTVASASGNTVVAGTLGVTGASTLTGLLNANGGIAVDTSAFTVADTTGVITLANGETIDNTTNGTINATGKLLVTGVRVANASDTNNLNEYFLGVGGNITGVGSVAGKNAKTYMLEISGTRQAGADTLWADFDDAGIKLSVTNKAVNNANSYILRGINAEARNRSGSGTVNAVNEITGMYITGKNQDAGSATNYLRGGWVRADADPSTVVNTGAFGLQVDFDFDANAPTDSAGVKAYYQSNGAYTTPLAAFEVSALANRSWQYGLVIDANSVGTADIKLQNNAIINNSTSGTISFGSANLTTTGAIIMPTSAETLVNAQDAGNSCSAANKGAIVIDAANLFYGCDGTNWSKLSN